MSSNQPRSIYCTIFDSNYVARAITLYSSFIKVNNESLFAFFCIDDQAADLLEKLQLQRCLIIRFEQYATSALLDTQETRSRGELCWTCKPIAMLHLMESYPNAEWVVYVDTDMMFFSDPDAVFESTEAHYLLTPHRFHREFLSYEKSAGKFNAGYLAARTTVEGWNVVTWWKERCLESCSATPGELTYGDQKYLNKFSDLFPCGEESKCLGLNLAPWNIDNYVISMENGLVKVDDELLILYHFQGLQIFDDGSASLYIGNKRIIDTYKRLIYTPYLTALSSAYRTIKQYEKSYMNGLMPKNKYLGSKVTQLVKKLIGRDNLVPFVAK